MRVLGLVTARGGSKGFPGKNLARLAGRPLVAWAWKALDEARRTWRDGELVLHLSTDDLAIAAAWPPDDRPCRLRPSHLAQDGSASWEVVLHELTTAAAVGRPCDAVLLLQPTSPLLTGLDLLALLAHLSAGASSALCVSPAPHPPQWALAVRDGIVHPLLPATADRQRQEQEPAWLPCGAWAMRSELVIGRHLLVEPGVSRAVTITPLRAVDIDRVVDLEDARTRLLALRAPASIDLGGRRLGTPAPCFVIAEAGVNHNGDPALAHRLIDAAAEAGADAVKFQTFQASTLVTAGAPVADYQRRTQAACQHDLLAGLELPVSAWRGLRDHAQERNLVFLSSAFDEASVDLLAGLGVPGLKFGSGELTNWPLLARAAATGLPLLVSTGMADLDEVEATAAFLRRHGAKAIAWFHCVSQYPAPSAAANLRALDSLRLAVGGPVGWSDHSEGHILTVAAVARGAELIEKHLTLDRSLPGPDHAASLNPHGFRDLVQAVRLVEAALGDGVKAAQPCETDVRRVARRSLVAARALPAGHILTAGDLVARRPGTGIAPCRLQQVLGRRLGQSLAVEELLREEDLQ